MSIIQFITCDNIIDANFIKNNLENENIECFLTNEISSTLLPGYTGMMNAGVQVMIDEKDVEKASVLINKLGDEKQIVCPACSSTNISYRFGKRRLNKYLLILISLFASTPVGKFKANYYCKDCNAEF